MRKIREMLSTFYYNINLRTKLIISYLILIVIPVFFLVFFSYMNIHKSVVEETEKAYLEALKQAEKNITFGIDAGYNIANLTQSNYDIQKILRAISERQLTSSEVIDFFSTLNNNVSNYEGGKNVIKVSYFMRGDPVFVSASPNFSSVNELRQEKLLEPLLEGKTKQVWCNSSEFEKLKLIRQDEIIYIREIRDINNIQNVLGYVMVELDSSFIWNIINDIKLPDGAEKVVRKNIKLVEPATLNNKSTYLTDMFLKSVRKEREGISKYNEGAGTYFAIESKVSGIDWDISLLMTEKQLGMNSKWIQNFMLILATIISFLAIVTAFFISGTITKRLKKLITLIKHAQRGDFETEQNIKGNDEYARLQRSFNEMSVKIKELIEEVYQAKISKQETEMKLLYAQINPHFLYNTLDIIQWSALRIDAGDIAEITESLAKFLRLSLNGGKENIKLSQEVEEVERYMQIINYRYKGAINFVTDIADGLGDLVVIKMLLQPLVENAVVHGIRSKEGKSGTIVIRAYMRYDFLFLEVHDDGVGIFTRDMSMIFENESKGYGVKNVHQRIQVHYGEECGLEFFSRPGIGCSAIVKLKLREKN